MHKCQKMQLEYVSVRHRQQLHPSVLKSIPAGNLQGFGTNGVQRISQMEIVVTVIFEHVTIIPHVWTKSHMVELSDSIRKSGFDTMIPRRIPVYVQLYLYLPHHAPPPDVTFAISCIF
jgi:hypothetical protein